MAEVIFWGKPGCQGNARQIALLRASDHLVEVRDLGAEHWTAATLRSFFGDQPVEAWFNHSAPRIKRGEIRPESLTEADALAMLIAAPLLIRRPLIAVAGHRVAGFDAELIAGWIGLAAGSPSVGAGCARGDAGSCSTGGSAQPQPGL